MHASPSLSVAFSWLACCLLAAPCCLCPFTCLLVAVCLLPPAMALLSLFGSNKSVHGVTTIIMAIVAVVVGTASATGHKPPRRRHRAAHTPRRQGGLSRAIVRGNFQCACCQRSPGRPWCAHAWRSLSGTSDPPRLMSHNCFRSVLSLMSHNLFRTPLLNCVRHRHECPP